MKYFFVLDIFYQNYTQDFESIDSAQFFMIDIPLRNYSLGR